MSKKDHSTDKNVATVAAPLLPAEAVAKLLVSIGLTPKYAEGVVKNVKLSNTFVEVCREAGVEAKGCNEKIGALLNKVATSLLPEWEVAMAHRKTVVSYIMNGKIKSNPQLEKVVAYFRKATKFDLKEFEEYCGVGVDVTPEQIAETVKKTIAAAGSGAGWSSQFKFVTDIKKTMPFADGALVLAEIEKQLTAAFGPKPAPGSDKKEPKKPAPSAAAAPAAGAAAAAAASPSSASSSSNAVSATTAAAGFDTDFADSARDLKWAHNTEEQKARCHAATKGVVYTRFPPEPNGFLHIGHAKSMRFNFGLAKRMNGGCIMRFDDTNPAAEKKVYIDSIHESMKWLGHTPVKVTHSSDYFPQLYDLAVILIKKDLAYVDHQTKDEMAASRATKTPSPYRNRPIAESLALFEDMRKGKFEEGKATLRLKGDLTSANPQLNTDMVAYRIKYTRHPHTGDKWCIYPSYDYSHCLIDSLEYITYSLCTLEFEARRESYFWLLDVLDMYKPKVWEFSRLNITHSVMSKRKLLQLVKEKYVNGWDDPRMFTVSGLRRRGYTPDSINEFCDKVGVSRTNNTIELHLLEACARQALEPIARRAFVVLNPVRLVLDNFDAKRIDECDAITLPKDKSTHKIPLTRVVYIEADDFMADSKQAKAADFYGFTPEQAVRLRYGPVIRYKSHTADASGRVSEIVATVDTAAAADLKLKGNLHWVAQPKPGVEPTRVEVRLYDKLFTDKDPGSADDFLALLNPDSLRVVPAAFTDASVADAKVWDKFQFERVGYFVVDPDSANGKLIFNRTVKLRDSKEAAPAAKPAAKDGAKKDKSAPKK